MCRGATAILEDMKKRKLKALQIIGKKFFIIEM